MVIFDSASIYVDSQATIQAKITAIDNIQAALLTSALEAAEKGAISEYQLNDGQTIIKAVYRSAKQIEEAYDSFERIKQRLINSLNGRMVRLVDRRNFNRR